MWRWRTKDPNELGGLPPPRYRILTIVMERKITRRDERMIEEKEEKENALFFEFNLLGWSQLVDWGDDWSIQKFK